MKEPKRLKLTDSPESKRVKLIRLESIMSLDEEIDENNTKNNKKSIQQLESKQTN